MSAASLEVTYTIKELFSKMQEEFERINIKIDTVKDLQNDTYYLLKEQIRRIDFQEKRMDDHEKSLENQSKRMEELEKQCMEVQIYKEEVLWKSKGFWGIITGTTALMIEALNTYARMKGYR